MIPLKESTVYAEKIKTDGSLNILKDVFVFLEQGEKVEGLTTEMILQEGKEYLVLYFGPYTIARCKHLGWRSEGFGEAKCSDSDVYVKEIGREIAVGRARKALELKAEGKRHFHQFCKA